MNEPVTSWPPCVVDGVLHQRLAEALGERAVHLALDDHRVEHVAAVVDRRVGDEIDVAGVGIDLDLGDVAAVGKRQRRVGLVLGVEAFAHLLGAARRLEQRNVAVGADHFEAAVAVLDVLSEASSSAEAIFLPFASMTSAVCTMAWPALIAEREPTEA